MSSDRKIKDKIKEYTDEVTPENAWKGSILNPKEKDKNRKFPFLYLVVLPLISIITLYFAYYVVYSERSPRTDAAILFTTLISLACGGIIDIIRMKKKAKSFAPKVNRE